MKICPSRGGKYDDAQTKCHGCGVKLHDVNDTGRFCKRCGRKLSKEDIVCPQCHEKKQNSMSDGISLKDDDPHHPPSESNHKKSNGCIIGVLLVVAGILIAVSTISIRPVLIFGTGSDTVSIPIGWNGTIQTPSAPQAKPKEKISGENLIFAFGTSSSQIDDRLDKYNYFHSTSNDQIIITSKNNKILYGLTGLDIGRCVTVNNFGETFGYDALTFYGYTVSCIEYSCLKKHSDTEISETDELALILFCLDVIDKAATYNDLRAIFVEKYGECTEEDTDADRGTSRAVWSLDNGRIVILENNSYTIRVQHQSADAYEREQGLRSIREREALERENAIRENR